jgi:ferritin-like protein
VHPILGFGIVHDREFMTAIKGLLQQFACRILTAGEFNPHHVDDVLVRRFQALDTESHKDMTKFCARQTCSDDRTVQGFRELPDF